MALILPGNPLYDRPADGGSAGAMRRVQKPGDRGFGEINNELADKGFLVTSTDDLITWARTGSLIG